jgi:hypothetical protein
MRGLAIALLCLAASGQEQLPRSTPKTDIGTGVKDVTVDWYDSVADYFRNSRRAVMLISQKGIPPEEIPAVLLIARRSSASPNQVIEAKKSGKSWAEIAKQHNAKIEGEDLVTEANVLFLSEYHGRPAEEIKAARAKGATFVDINQEFRRSGTPLRRKTAQ